MVTESNKEFLYNLKGKSVLITGASGFLGSYLSNLCYENEAKLYGIDIRPPENKDIWIQFHVKTLQSLEIIELFNLSEFDYIFHLAGSASVPFSIEAPLEDFNSLLPPTVHLLYLIKRYCPNAHLISFSSAAVYGNPYKLPINEDTPRNPLSPYGIHKALCEDLLQYYSKYYDLKISVLRIFSAYGEGLRKQLFFDAVKKFISNPKEIHFFGTGKETRDFIHGHDVARASVFIALRDVGNFNYEVFNVASGIETKVEDVLNALFYGLKFQPNIVFNQKSHIGNPSNWLASIEKLSALGFSISKNVVIQLPIYRNWVLNVEN